MKDIFGFDMTETGMKVLKPKKKKKKKGYSFTGKFGSGSGNPYSQSIFR